MKTGLGLIAAALCLSGCVGTDVMSSVTPSGSSPQFGYPRIEQAALPVLPPAAAPAAPAASVQPAQTTSVAAVSAPLPSAVQAPAPAPARAQAIYDEARDPAFATLLADANTAEAMPDLPLKNDGSMKLPPSPKLAIIDIDDTRTSLQASE